MTQHIWLDVQMIPYGRHRYQADACTSDQAQPHVIQLLESRLSHRSLSELLILFIDTPHIQYAMNNSSNGQTYQQQGVTKAANL